MLAWGLVIPVAGQHPLHTETDKHRRHQHQLCSSSCQQTRLWHGTCAAAAASPFAGMPSSTSGGRYTCMTFIWWCHSPVC